MLGGILDFEAFNAGHMLKKAADNPEQLLLGAADPFGAKVWGSITGKDYSPIVNQWGGATEDAYKAAEAKGINTAAGRGMHNVAQSIAGIYAGGAAANGLGFGGTAGNAGQGLQVGSGSATSPYSLAPSTTRTGLLSGNAGQGLSATTGNGVQLTPSTAKSSGLSGIFNSDNMKTAGNMVDMAGKLGIFDDPQAPAAPSAGIPARQADFSGLLRSQGQANNAAGAQRLLQQQMARKQGRL